MARLRVPAPNFWASSAPPLLPTRYLQVLDAVEEGTSTLTEIGRDAIDVWACMLARCQLWKLTVTSSGSGTDPSSTGPDTAYANYTFSYSMELELAVTPLPSVEGYEDHPEVGLAMHEFLTGAGGTTPEPVGKWDVSGESAGTPFDYSGGWRVSGDLSFGVSGEEYLGSGSLTPFAGPLCVGTTLYIPFLLNLSNTALGTIPSPDYPRISHFVTTLRMEYIPELGPVSLNHVGTLTIQVPDWRNGSGNVSLSAPLYAMEIAEAPPGSPGTHTVTATLTPADGSYLPYGSGNANETPVWNSSGMALVDPLVH